MFKISDFPTGTEVVIYPEWAAGRHGGGPDGVLGYVANVAVAHVEGIGDVECLMVYRHDNVKGAGPDGTWVCPVFAVEPYNLLDGTPVDVRTYPNGWDTRTLYDAGRHPRVGVRMRSMEDRRVEFLAQHSRMPVSNTPKQHDLIAETDPPEGYAYDSEGTLHKLNDGGRYASPLPNDSAARKELPIGKVFFGMFPAAMVGVTENVMAGNRKHLGDDPDVPKHDRSKSADHLDCIMRHAMDGDIEAVATRALMWLQEVRESEGAPRAPRAFNFPDKG
ncbi:hypothetical protein [Stenotrophomonas phage BUCT603]|nr:hypothetical protein [Stenotrophomonas phage BUCT603]